jgi:hypothetical protein
MARSKSNGSKDFSATIGFEAKLVDCLVALTGQFFYSTQITVCLWFLAKDKSGAASNARAARTRAVFGFTNKESFEKLRFAIPPTEIVAAYECQAAPLDTQSRTLAALRDTLLPKVLSGNIRTCKPDSKGESLCQTT